MDQGVCVSVCACWTEDVEVNEEWAQKKRDDANTDETRNCDEQRGMKENGDEWGEP